MESIFTYKMLSLWTCTQARGVWRSDGGIIWMMMDSLYCVQNKVLVDAAEEAVDVVTEITEDEGEGDLVSTDMVG